MSSWESFNGKEEKMRLRIFVLIAGLGGCTSASGDPLDPNQFRQFSSRVTVEYGERKDVFDYTRDGSKLRIVPVAPATTPQGEPMDKVAIIVDLETKTATGISYGRRQFYVQPVTEMAGASPFSTAEKHEILAREELGTETVGTHACGLQRLKVRSADGSEQSVKVWTAADLNGFPIKIQMDRKGIELTTTSSDVKLGATTDASLFVVPSDFTNAAGG